MAQHTCSVCGNVSDGLENTCVHQRRIVIDMIEEMYEKADEADMMFDYEEWKAGHPEEAVALHERMVDLVCDVIEKVKRENG